MTSRKDVIDTNITHLVNLSLSGPVIDINVNQARDMFDAGLLSKAIVKREFDSWMILFFMSNSSMAVLVDSRGSTRGFKLINTALKTVNTIGFANADIHGIDAV